MPSVVEVKLAATLAYPNDLTPTTVNIDTVLVPSDVVVAINGVWSSSASWTVTGMGGGWQNAFGDIGDVEARWVTGKSGSGNSVTFAQGGRALPRQNIVVMVLRGLNQPILGGVQYTTKAVQGYPGWFPTPLQDYSAGCIAVAAFNDYSGASGMVLVTTPSTDWVSDASYATNPAHEPDLIVSHHIGLTPATNLTAHLQQPSGVTDNEGAVMVFGQPIIPKPFRGWGRML